MTRDGDFTISHPIRVAATPPTSPAMPPSRQKQSVTAEVCTARRADGEPCWLRVHTSRPHLTRDLTGDELRDAPDALRDRG